MTGADLLSGTLYGLSGASLLASAVALGMKRTREYLVLTVTGLGLLAVECALERAWFGLAWNAGLIAVFLGSDWWTRHGRKVAKALGEKSRAVLAAVVAKWREAGSSPVPEGVPG